MQANFALEHEVLLAGQAQTLYVMAYVTAGPAHGDHTRRALNLSLVIDRSGSMAGDKIDYTRQAAQLLVQNLGMRDILSVVLYNDKVETLLLPEPVRRKDAINDQIGRIRPGGTTNLSGGWLEGCTLVAKNHQVERLNRVILISDGLANRGVTDPKQIVEMVAQKRATGVSTTTMGLGADFNEDLLMEMASAGGGAYYFIESAEVTPAIFNEELRGLLSLVGQNLTVQVETGVYVSSVDQLNAYPTEHDGAQTTYRLGDLFGSEVKAIVLALHVGPVLMPGEYTLANIRFGYEALGEGGTEHKAFTLPLTLRVVEADDKPRAVNADVRRNVLLLKAARARRKAVELADKGQYNDAARVLREMVAEIDQSGITDDSQLNEERRALQQQADEIQAGAGKYDEYARKTMSTQAFYTMTNRHDQTMVLRVREAQREAAPQAVEPAALSSGETPTHLRWEGQGQTFTLSGDVIRIGRSTHNEIAVLARGVSRFHCHLKRVADRLILEDLDSTNGTRINGQEVSTPYTVSVGDTLELSSERLVFTKEENPT